MKSYVEISSSYPFPYHDQFVDSSYLRVSETAMFFFFTFRVHLMTILKSFELKTILKSYFLSFFFSGVFALFHLFNIQSFFRSQHCTVVQLLCTELCIAFIAMQLQIKCQVNFSLPTDFEVISALHTLRTNDDRKKNFSLSLLLFSLHGLIL